MRYEELRTLFLFDGLPDEDLERLASLGEEVRFVPGEVLFEQGQAADFWWVLLEGRVDLFRRVAREETLVAHVDEPGRWAGGFRAWSDDAGYLTKGQGATEGRMFRVPSAALGEWARATFPLGAHFIEGFFGTVRTVETAASQREALIALGTLAAGLAHEINNPAAATARAVDSLRDSSDGLHRSLVQLAERSLRPEQFVALDALRREVGTTPSLTDPLAIAEKEEELGSWLDDRGVADAWRIAPTLAAAGVGTEWLERVVSDVGEQALEPGVTWVASRLAMTSLLDEMEEATSRVSALVAAVKSYTQLDRASLQLIDVTEGLESTLVMLGHKLRDGVTVVRDFGEDVPRVEANPAELNQVWTNLVDNAIDAMDGSGTLVLTTRVDGEDVVVEIADDGPGMSADVVAHAFEPFFTTKEVGKGTGLGLDISRRIVVERHHGDISIDSRPGRTVLAIRLPQRHVE